MTKVLSHLFRLSVTILISTLLICGQKRNSGSSVTGFGGECIGVKRDFSAALKSLIERDKTGKSNPCNFDICESAFAYDLNSDGKKEYFVPLACGATGNCLYGVFSDRPAKRLGKFEAWFFY